MKDARPHGMAAGPEVDAIASDAVAKLSLVMREAFDRVAALDGNPAERENDALSVVATIATFAQAQLIGRLVERKKVELDTALFIAGADVAKRLDHHLAEAFAQFSGRTH